MTHEQMKIDNTLNDIFYDLLEIQRRLDKIDVEIDDEEFNIVIEEKINTLFTSLTNSIKQLNETKERVRGQSQTANGIYRILKNYVQDNEMPISDEDLTNVANNIVRRIIPAIIEERNDYYKVGGTE